MAHHIQNLLFLSHPLTHTHNNHPFRFDIFPLFSSISTIKSSPIPLYHISLSSFYEIFQGLSSWLIRSTSWPIVNLWCRFQSERERWMVLDPQELIGNYFNPNFISSFDELRWVYLDLLLKQRHLHGSYP